MFAIRVPFAVVAGTLSSFAIFLGLAQLVGASLEIAPSVEARVIEFTRQIIDTPLVNKREPKVTREPPILEPGPMKVSASETGDSGVIDYRGPTLDPVIDRGRLSRLGLDGDVTPLVRPNPDYPARAIAGQIEGWVKVQFSVTVAGTVRDAVVVDSEPGTIFDEAALKAIARWRYNPRVVDGTAVERVGLQALIRFELDN